MPQENKQSLNKMRHSCEHVLTQAMLKLYPGIKMAMGPATETGFYFDFDSDYSDHQSYKISEADFPKIESEMKKIIKANLPFICKEVSVKEARKLFKDNQYKQEWLDEISKKGEKAVLYWTAKEFVDLCSGPHLKSTGEIKVFKLLSVAGAYWHGDEKNKMLTRVYGTCFNTQKELDHYLWQLEEAEKGNHRKIGKELELFAIFPNEIGPGLPVWLSKGYAMRRVIEDYMIQLERKFGYEHILTPHISRQKLFQTSRHLDFYDESMYPPMDLDNDKYYLKPMNCPAGMMVYRLKPRSYRDLPMKIGELGTVYRFEKSGELHGLQRVRGFTQNDAHIFCTPEQLDNQLKEVMQMLKIFYKDLGFEKYSFRLGISDPKNKKFKACGSRSGWLKAEKALQKVLDDIGADYEINIGEAAFYGPKIDVQAVNVFGKEDSISTNQVDFNLPEAFDIKYIDKNNQEKRPFVIHRALVGSFERLFAFLIEHYGGAFPVWFAPTQVIVLPISDKHHSYAKKLKKLFLEEKLRVELDDRRKSLPAKIRDAQLQKIPFMLIVGDKEKKNNTVSVRQRGKKDLGTMSIDKFIGKLKDLIEKKAQV